MPASRSGRVPPGQGNDPFKGLFRIKENLFGRKDAVLAYGRTEDMLEAVFPRFDRHDYTTRKSRIFDASDFGVSLFSAEEIDRLNRFKSLKKQLEWTAGRFLLKNLVLRYAGKNMDPSGITVSYRDMGAPFLPDFSFLDISLSHSGNITAAAAMPSADGNIGLDVEHIGRAPGDAFLRTAFTHEERKRMGTEAEGIFTSWTVKEAFLKLIKKGFNESLHAVEVLDGKVFYHGRPVPVEIESEKVGTAYILTVLSGKPA